MSILYRNYRHWYFNQDLLLHIQNGENDKVRSILQHVADCHLISCTSGATLLHFAAKYGNVEISQYLIDLGANVDAENCIKETPLMYAVKDNQLSTARMLLDFEEMKRIDIDEFVTLFDFLTADGHQICLYARNKVFICNLTVEMKVLSINNNSDSGRILKKRLMRFSRLIDWKGKTLATMNKILSELCNLYINNIAEEIVEYSVRQKWEDIVRAST